MTINLSLSLAETLSIIGGMIFCIVGVVIWNIRLEASVNLCMVTQEDLTDQVKELRIKHEALDGRIFEKLSNVEKSLAKIEGRLSIKSEGE